MPIYIKNMLEIFGIVYLRFNLLPRLWCVWLVAINAVSLYFIQYTEAQVVFGVTVISVLIQSLIYQKNGFTRILGIVHFLWVPMFLWIGNRVDAISQNHDFYMWLVVLFITNFASLIIDISDNIRYFKGEKNPHYYW